MPSLKNPPDVLVLTRREIGALMNLEDYLAAAEHAFRALALGQSHAPMPMQIHRNGGAFHVKGASMEGERSLVAFKVNGNFPGNTEHYGLPTIQGAIVLADAVTGSPLAIMDSIEITLRRTAAASALAARYLAHVDASRVAICGCGGQARAQLEAVAAVRPPKSVAVWDRDAERAQIFAGSMERVLRAPVRAVGALEEATADADIILTCTTSRSPFLGSRHVSKGAFVAAVGTDNPEKSEIAPELMARAAIVPDVLDQCLVMGDLHHAVAVGLVVPADVRAELGDVVVGRKPGRIRDDEIIIFDSTGTAVQDVAAAAVVYERAAERGIGLRAPLGAA